MSNITPIPSMPATMTSSQLAEMLGYELKEVNRKIRNMFGDKIEGGKIPPSFDSRGYVAYYNLPELESKMFVAKHNIEYLEQIIQFWIDNKTTQNKLPELTTQDLISIVANTVKEQIEESFSSFTVLKKNSLPKTPSTQMAQNVKLVHEFIKQEADNGFGIEGTIKRVSIYEFYNKYAAFCAKKQVSPLGRSSFGKIFAQHYDFKRAKTLTINGQRKNAYLFDTYAQD